MLTPKQKKGLVDWLSTAPRSTRDLLVRARRIGVEGSAELLAELAAAGVVVERGVSGTSGPVVRYVWIDSARATLRRALNFHNIREEDFDDRPVAQTRPARRKL